MAVAAYASLLSLTRVLDNVLLPSRRHLLPDAKQIEILHEKLGLLQEFLENYSSRIISISKLVTEDLLRKITDATKDLDDLVNIYVVDKLRGGSTDQSHDDADFCQDVNANIQKLDSIKQELMIMMVEDRDRDIRHERTKSSVPASSSTTASDAKSSTTVGFEEPLVRIMDKLTSSSSKPNLQIIPIVGMGGIGKTTLARNAFDNRCIIEHFRLRIWFTISLEYNVQQILNGLLNDGVLGDWASKEDDGDLAELGVKLYQKLYGRRYLVVMDDVWSPEAWVDMRSFFPDNANGSRVIVTTRLSNVASSLGCENSYRMSFLDNDKSWKLFSEKAFATGGRSPILEEIGWRIVRSCRGLPLALVVVGGLLANSNMTKEYWEFVAKDVNSFANSEDDENCLKILSLSYNHLPIHLKPCLLYMGTFQEDRAIRVTELIKLWVSEGFIKPLSGKTLEDVALKYLKDLAERNVILIRQRGNRGNIKECGVHDLLRDLCIRELHKERIFSIQKVNFVLVNEYNYGCFICGELGSRERVHLCEVILGSHSKSSISLSVCDACIIKYPDLNRLRFVRVIDKFKDSSSNSPQTTNSRCLLHSTKLRCLDIYSRFFLTSPCTISLLWNLQSLYIGLSPQDSKFLLSEIWDMPQLRHVKVDVLFDPVLAQLEMKKGFRIMENLQTLTGLYNFRLTEDVVKRIPNLKTLSVDYYYIRAVPDWSYYCLHNLACLHKLKSLYLSCDSLDMRKITFPISLKKLTLHGCGISWEEDMTIIGALPNLDVLKLKYGSVVGEEWNPVEGQFLQLKYLKIDDLDLMLWVAEDIHYPILEKLVLEKVHELEAIPLGIGDIPTLPSITLGNCSNCLKYSAKQVIEEQRGYGNENLRIVIDGSTIH